MKHCAGPSCDKYFTLRNNRKGLYCSGRCKKRARNDRMSRVPCSLDGCTNGVYNVQTGYCSKHYQRYKKHGDPSVVSRLRDAPEGTRKVWADGYMFIRVRQPDGGLRFVPEHRHVMEKYLGRTLLDGENVHHKDGNRQNNEVSNLELWTTSQPAGQRVEDKIEWAKTFLSQYEYVVHSLLQVGDSPWTRY